MEGKNKMNGFLKWGLISFGVFILIGIIGSVFSNDDNSNAENNNLPEFTILKIDTPHVLPNGNISPAENLEYTIEIPHPLLEDSLKLLQGYFIKKGENDYPGVNKIVVRVYINGTSTKALPYASLLLIGGNEQILITGGSRSVDFVNEKLSDYSILGCWIVYEESDYILCKKDGLYYEAYVNKKQNTISELKPIKTKKKNGAVAYYSPDNHSNEYMIIREDGLYIYDESGVSGDKPVVWSTDPLWQRY